MCSAGRSHQRQRRKQWRASSPTAKQLVAVDSTVAAPRMATG